MSNMNMKQKALWSSLLILILSVVIAASVALRTPRAKTEVALKAGKGIELAAPDQKGPDVQGLVVALRPAGFTPSAFELTEGKYLFIVQNRCGIRGLTFQMFRDSGEKLHEVNDRKPQWKNQFDLHPGTYVLSVLDHPEWRCVIKVKPQ